MKTKKKVKPLGNWKMGIAKKKPSTKKEQDNYLKHSKKVVELGDLM